MTVFNLAVGAGPAVLLWLGKVVIDQIASFGRTTSLDWGLLTGNHAPLMWSMVGFVVINLILDSVETFGSFQLSSLRDQLNASSQQLLFTKVSSFTGVEIFESPQLLNLITLAENSIPKLQYLAIVVYNLMTGAFVLVPTIILSASLAWWVPLLIFVVSIPSVYVQLDYETRQWSVESAQATTVRKMNAHAEVLIKPAFAKDLRMYGLAPYFLQSWRTLFMAAFAEMRALRRQGTTRTLFWSLLSGIGTGLPYLFVVLEALQGHLTIGDVALYAGLVFQVRRSLYMLITNTTQLQQISLGANAFFELLDYEDTGNANVARESEEERSDKVEGAPGIELIDVSFTYPGAVQPALREINLSIAPGETLVIVGENGAGKTTLAKLLCRLYRPSAGKILWNSNDYSSMDIHAFRQNVAVVFQDFARFPATLRENIGFGRLSALSDDEAVLSAAGKGGLRDLITGLPRHLETPLSKQLDDGVELSGGQWQRVAIARALMRPTAQFVILDEPTAALDPHTEYEALEVFRNMAQEKTALIVSHRLALARIATKIIVMERGQIVEQGTHDELMKAGQRYWSMFTRQASSYLESNASAE
ncbi:ABC transporter ATP-binding protein [Dictyobacter formicarum]|uniref:HlyB/MsbA family ABC transporter n=1 Tax=Dictyobacter formicarum TaxID=2778368 RepID=A0ABQ3VIG7_9CHLR|nr:ABC transporter ATP-binding protein [Dictyobacter formicarum]GHO84916.1 HlyB/MsbA family ABC transporter [Dictyobacter formicarum]